MVKGPPDPSASRQPWRLSRSRVFQQPAVEIVAFLCVPAAHATASCFAFGETPEWGRWVGGVGSRTQALLSAVQDHGPLPCRPVGIRRFSGPRTPFCLASDLVMSTVHHHDYHMQIFESKYVFFKQKILFIAITTSLHSNYCNKLIELYQLVLVQKLSFINWLYQGVQVVLPCYLFTFASFLQHNAQLTYHEKKNIPHRYNHVMI